MFHNFILFIFLFYLKATYCEYQDFIIKVKGDRRDIRSDKLKIKPIAITKSCNEDKLMFFLADTQIVNPESIVLLALDDSPSVCRQTMKTLTDIQQYLNTCVNPPEDDLYMSLIRGLKTMFKKCCDNMHFYKQFSQYVPCLRGIIDDLEECGGPADWVEDEDKHKVCKNYKLVIECYYIKAAEVCGKCAANALEDLGTTILSSVIRTSCTIFINPSIPAKDKMPDTIIERMNVDKNGNSIVYSSSTKISTELKNTILFSLYLIKQIQCCN